jgi:aryl-alcohol dehydrogenase-like predicted oxidoreductase
MRNHSELAHLNVAAIDPAIIPSRTLCTGVRIPAIGLGTFGADHVSHAAVAGAVRYAASIGYRHFDCASVYGNEYRVGEVFHELFRSDFIARTSGLRPSSGTTDPYTTHDEPDARGLYLASWEGPLL